MDRAASSVGSNLRQALPAADDSFRLFAQPPLRCGFVVWFTGLPSAGKSTLAAALARRLRESGLRVEELDGDSVRSVFPATGYTRDERTRHIRQMGYIASLLERNGICVVASFVSPYREARAMARSFCRNFIEVHVAASLAECERRDVKGLYRRAREGSIAQFTGVSDPYEEPLSAELRIDTGSAAVDDCVAEICRYLADGGFRRFAEGESS